MCIRDSTIGYQALTAHLLTDRQVVIDVSGVVQAAGSASQEEAAERTAEVLQTADAPTKDEAAAVPTAQAEACLLYTSRRV